VGGVFTTLDVPSATATQARGISNSGQIVGTYAGLGDQGVLDSSNTFSNIDVPGAASTDAGGINDSGMIVGVYSDSNSLVHGFSYVNDTFSSPQISAAQQTLTIGINDLGQIVGVSGSSGFLYAGGTFTTINVPGASETAAEGINNAGQIVGFYLDSTGAARGFLATPEFSAPTVKVIVTTNSVGLSVLVDLHHR
jgi:hypothetical protein